MGLNYFIILFVYFEFIICIPVHEVEFNNNTWTITNENGTIVFRDQKIPSGIFSAYAESIGSTVDGVLYGKNDVNYRWLAHDNWIYTNTFQVDEKIIKQTKYINLVFYGIDTIAEIKLNNQTIGKTDNMFVRYTFEVHSNNIIKISNTLEIKIFSPILMAKKIADLNNYTPPECPPSIYNGECHMNMLRKMQASFGWDWGLAAPSMGIWKRVTLEYYDIAIIRDVDVTTTLNGNGSWTLNVTIDLDTKKTDPYYGELFFYAVELLGEPIKKTFTENNPITNSVINFQVLIEKDSVELWWPNGLGNQKLYHLHFTFNGWREPDGNDPRHLTLSQKSIRIGFRTIELVQEKMDNGLSFYFKVNGHPVFMRGTNYIPSHILPELGQEQDRVRHLMTSVKEANMNMIRVWGGGVYESDFLYDMADINGILIWQDMMFGCAMYPVSEEFLSSVRIEVKQNIKRIAHHASIAIIAGNNENEAALMQNWYGTAVDMKRFKREYRKLYNGTINDELRKFYNHPSRPEPLTSSPSNGEQTKDHDYLAPQPQDPNYGDIHFYEYFRDWSDPNMYPVPRFSSEYGFQSMPSNSSWQRILGRHDTLKDMIAHRQHLPGGSEIIPCVIFHQLPLIRSDHDDYDVYLMYFSQIAQALATKMETEVYRKNRIGKQMTMGALYWQLNDVWIAPSWSSIDYNGNYKILHYWAKEFMSPISIIAHSIKNTTKVEVTVVRDTIDHITMNLNIVRNVYKYERLGLAKRRIKKSINIGPNTAVLADTFDIESDLKSDSYFYEILLENAKTNETIAKTYHFPEPIKKAVGIKNSKIKIQILSRVYQDPITSVSIAITIDCPALFVYLELTLESRIIKYKLSENAFIQTEPIKVVYLEYKDRIEITEEHIKVYTINQYMNNEKYPKIEELPSSCKKG